MRRAAFVLTIALVAHAWPLPAQSRAPTFHSGVELVALSVSVVDRRQQFVSDLGRADFEVFDNGVRRELAFFGAAAVPVDVVLLLDISSSMEGRIATVANAAVGFIRMLRPADRAAVIGFATHVAMLQTFTGDATRLETSVRRARPFGKTALHDALYIAAHELRRERLREGAVRRQALVLLSDGLDTASLASADEALDAIRQTGVVVFAISPEARLEFGRLPWSRGRAAAEAIFTLSKLARETGGRPFFLEDLANLADVYADVATEIQHQYTLGFEPDDDWRGGKFRQLLVRVVSRADAIVRTRRGYDPSR